ncbi:hypothetical protein DB032_19515 [Chromobacterium sp. Panama]|uniref:hypothetical protein n=1 Tax=Chromobacterium sp. Panama TaxID=2161826 RepID=UPI000D3050C0|nr:hypothetical protein [Chromobacterium sp. Panama]PTU66955.1 hypothetical protein DB032_19515 [Chromobacterium sp. Panama]
MGLQWSERLALQQHDAGIVLFREGMFARMYEVGAWRFVRQVRPLKISVRRIKKLGQDVVYCGLPIASLPAVGVALESYDETNACWRLPGSEAGVVGFDEWRCLQLKAAHALAGAVAGFPPGNGSLASAGWLERIAALDPTGLSPMEAWACLNALRREALLKLGEGGNPQKGDDRPNP